MVPRNRNAAQSAVEGIEDYIRRHNLHVGDLLPSEMELCDELGCSRSSLREAMRTLVSLDIVEVRQGQGTFVSKMSLAPLIRGMVLRVTLDVDQSFEHLLQVVDTRQALEVSLADELAQVHDEDSIHELHELVNAMYRRFHATLLRQTRNQLIRELSDALWQVNSEVVPLLDLSMAEDTKRTLESHWAMVEALRKKSSQAFKDAVRQHYAPLRHAVSLQRQHGSLGT